MSMSIPFRPPRTAPNAFSTSRKTIAPNFASFLENALIPHPTAEEEDSSPGSGGCEDSSPAQQSSITVTTPPRSAKRKRINQEGLFVDSGAGKCSGLHNGGDEDEGSARVQADGLEPIQTSPTKRRRESFTLVRLPAGSTVIASVSWENRWPEIVTYYRYHRPDFTGLGTCAEESRYPREFAFLAAASQENVSVQILGAEAVRATNRLPQHKIDWLYARTVELVNIALRDEKRCTTNFVIGSVAGLASLRRIFGAYDEAATHMRGVKRMIDLRGGMHVLDDSPTLRNFILAISSVLAFDMRSPDIFEQEQRQYGKVVSLAASHPLRLALLPAASALPPWRVRSLHLVLFSKDTPLQMLLKLMLDFSIFVDAALEPPYAWSPFSAQAVAHGFEEKLLALAAGPPSRCFGARIFSDKDLTAWDEAFELVRTSMLVLVAWCKLVIIAARDGGERSRLEHCAMMQCSVPVMRTLERRPDLGLWVLCVRAGFTTGVIREQALDQASMMCAELQIDSLEDLKICLALTFFSPAVMGDTVSKVWDGIHPRLAAFDFGAVAGDVLIMHEDFMN